MKMSTLARYFYGCDEGGKKGNEEVGNEGDDVGSGGRKLHSLHLALF